MILKLNSLIVAGAKFLLTNSTARNTAKSLLETAFNSLSEILCSNMSLEEVAKKYSPKLKNIITQYQDTGAKHQAGKFKIIYRDEKSFVMNFELYFKDSEEKWINVENTSSTLDSRKWLSPEALKDLRKNKEKIFSINTNGR